MQIKTLALAAALSLSALSASALTLQPYEVAKGSKTFTTAGAFSDSYLIDFSPAFLGADADVGFAFTELRLKNVVDIEFGSISFSNTYNGPSFLTLLPTSAPPFTADVASAEFTRPTTVPFYMTVAGTAVGTGANKGSYSFEFVAAPVPEPQTYALALSGLALVGWVASRRRRDERV